MDLYQNYNNLYENNEETDISQNCKNSKTDL